MKGETSAIRFSEAQKLLDYGFNNYEYKTFANKNDTIKAINVDKGIFPSVDAIVEEDALCLVKKQESSNITTYVSLPDAVIAPITAGQKLGEIVFSIGDKKIASTNIVAKNDVKNVNFGNMLSRIIENWFSLLR